MTNTGAGHDPHRGPHQGIPEVCGRRAGVGRADASDTFADVPADHPFYTEIEWLASTAITTGFEDGTFGPTLPVTRQAIAAYLYRYNQALGDDVCAAPTRIARAECDALVALYNTTSSSPDWTDNTGWVTTATPCDWNGVTCTTPETPASTVTDVNLPNNNITGPVPPEIGDLTNLTDLHLDKNDLTGSIPTDLTILTNLLLTDNALSGPVPVEMLNLTGLSRFDPWAELANGCFTSSSPALTAWLNGHDGN